MATQAVRSNTTPKIPLPNTLPPAARAKVEQAIEAHCAARDALIAFLDEADGDPEDDEDELDQDVTDEPHDPGDDDEPSLGSQSGAWETANQATWAVGGLEDLEEEHDGREFGYTETHGRGGAVGAGTGDDDEPSLAHTNDVDQARALKNATGTVYGPGRNTWHGHDRDLEAEHDGREPSLGSVERNFASFNPATFSQQSWGRSGTDDREHEDDREPDVDCEPNSRPTMECEPEDGI